MPDTTAPHRRRLAATLLLVVAAATALAGCGTGFNAYTNTQGQSGNGVFATTGAVSVQGATIVLGPEGDRSATLTGSFYNAGPDGDVLVEVKMTDPTPKQTLITGDRLLLPPAKDVRVGFESLAHINFYGVELTPATYVPVTFLFERAGQISTELLVVPAEGYYEGIRPVPAAPLPQGVAEASPTS